MDNDIFEISLRRQNPSRSPDYWTSDVYPLGKRSADSDRYTGFRCYIKEPTSEYPDPGFFLQIRGGKGQVFVRTSPTDLRGLANWLLDRCDDAESKSAELAPKSIQCHAIARAVGTVNGLKPDSELNAIPEIIQQLSAFENHNCEVINKTLLCGNCDKTCTSERVGYVLHTGHCDDFSPLELDT